MNRKTEFDSSVRARKVQADGELSFENRVASRTSRVDLGGGLLDFGGALGFGGDGQAGGGGTHVLGPANEVVLLFLAFVLGWWLGDGSLGHGGNHIGQLHQRLGFLFGS